MYNYVIKTYYHVIKTVFFQFGGQQNVEYSFSGSSQTSGYFYINPSTGQISVQRPLTDDTSFGNTRYTVRNICNICEWLYVQIHCKEYGCIYPLFASTLRLVDVFRKLFNSKKKIFRLLDYFVASKAMCR